MGRGSGILTLANDVNVSRATEPPVADGVTTVSGPLELLPWFGEFLAGVLLVVGALFSLLAVIGIIRMPDLYTRMQAATKAGTLGVACLILGVAAHFGEASIAFEALLIVLFIFLTTPIASHLIARAAYFVRTPIWDATWRDDLHGSYDADLSFEGDGSIDVDPSQTQARPAAGNRPPPPKDKDGRR